MLEKPPIDDALLVMEAEAGYGLRAAALTFLPLGADLNTAVYRLDDAAGDRYFLKLRSGSFDESSVAVPRFLHDRGLTPIMAPLRTLSGGLWREVAGYHLMLYPFVVAQNGFTRPLSEAQWRLMGIVLRRVHEMRLPDALRERLPIEAYSGDAREQLRGWLTGQGARLADDEAAEKLAALLAEKRSEVNQLVERAERLAERLRAELPELSLCHADLHGGNVLVEEKLLHLVDWDTLLLAPKERDLMFVGAGIGGVWDQPQEAEWFYQGYGAAAINLVALAYYRYERIVQDIAVTCQQLFLGEEGGADRLNSLGYVADDLRPSRVVEIAHETYRALGADFTS